MDEYAIAETVTPSFDCDSLTEAFAIAGDAGFSAFLKSGALDGVPLVSGLSKIYRGVEAIGEYLFRKKVAKFLFGLKSTTADERRRFFEGFNNNEDRREFGETIIFLLSSLDDSIKPEMCGRIIAAMIQNNCSQDLAFRTINSIKAAYVGDFAIFEACCLSMDETIPPQQPSKKVILVNTVSNMEDSVNSFYKHDWIPQSISAQFDRPPSDKPTEVLNFELRPIGEILFKYGLSSDFISHKVL